MKRNLSLEALDKLVAAGKIRGYVLNNAPKKKKANKYGNTKVEVDGILFDSKKEAKVYGELKLRLKKGEIAFLERQVVYVMEVEGKKICEYWADFRYIEAINGQMVVVDVKSDATRKLSTYRLKKKLMLAIHKIEIKEV